MVDGGADGEVRSKTGKRGLFQQHDDGFAVLLTFEGPFGVFAGHGDTAATGFRGKHPRIGKTAA